MMSPTKVLFLCQHNSARSQMAEAYLTRYGGDKFKAESAGLEAGSLNPFAVAVMKEDGIDISRQRAHDVFDYFKEGRTYHYVITVCDEATAAKCPIFPGVRKTINWSFHDPSAFKGTDEERLSATRNVRDEIRSAIRAFISDMASA